MKKAEPEIQPISFFPNDFGVKMQEIAIGILRRRWLLWGVRERSLTTPEERLRSG
jgi:hypothetical protein